MKVFGPIPSRRLGRSLGINNIPPKTCSYSCVYCQVGRTTKMQIEREKFYEPQEILFEVNKKINAAQKFNEPIDFLTFVPDGEPTLDLNLGNTIEQLKIFDIKIAVITNGSLLGRRNVQEDLFKADLLSIKIDSVNEQVWRKINRPHHTLNLSKLFEDIDSFCQLFSGDLITETMIVQDLNDSEESLKGIASLIHWLEPTKAYLTIPTRPPAESGIEPPKNEVINKAFQIFNKKINDVELLTGYEGNDFTYTGDLEKELLSILSVHPMRGDAMKSFLTKSDKGWSVLQKLLFEKKLVQVEYGGKEFYQRNFKR